MKNAGLQYPVFLLDRKEKMVYVHHDESQMRTMNIEIFKQTNFENMILVDSSGAKYTIKNAYVKGSRGYREESPQEQVVSFDFSYKEVGAITPEELKNMIMELYVKSRRFHALFHNISDFGEKMSRSETFQQIAILADGATEESGFHKTGKKL